MHPLKGAGAFLLPSSHFLPVADEAFGFGRPTPDELKCPVKIEDIRILGEAGGQ